MKILFVHQNFPGQFPHLAPALAARMMGMALLLVAGVIFVLTLASAIGGLPFTAVVVTAAESEPKLGSVLAMAAHTLPHLDSWSLVATAEMAALPRPW